MLEYPLWGSSPAGYRVTNWGLHWISTSLCFIFFLRLTQQPVSAWFLAVCFAIHPSRIENVVWLAQRKDVLAAVFGFAALCCFQQWQVSSTRKQNGYWYGFTLVMYWGALASKAQWVPLCLVFLCLDWYKGHLNRSRIWAYIPFFGLTGLFSWWAYQAQILETQFRTAFSLWEWFNSPARDIAIYFKLTFWPIDLYPRTPPMLFVAWQAAIGWGILLIWGIVAWKKWSQNRAYAFGFAWFLLFLSPMLNLVPGMLIANDRYLYVSILGLFFPFAFWLGRQSPERGISGIVLTGVVCWILTLSYLPVWKDDLSLWSNAVTHNPTNVRALHNLLSAAQARNDSETQYVLLQQLVRLEPHNLEYRKGLGVWAYRFQNHQEAAENLAYSYRQDLHFKEDASNCFLLGYSLLVTQRPKESLEPLMQAIKGAPQNPQYWYTLGDARLALGQSVEALECYNKVLKLDPSQPQEVKAKITKLEQSLHQAHQPTKLPRSPS
jgi:Flp pilus assembly protein TadD